MTSESSVKKKVKWMNFRTCHLARKCKSAVVFSSESITWGKGLGVHTSGEAANHASQPSDFSSSSTSESHASLSSMPWVEHPFHGFDTQWLWRVRAESNQDYVHLPLTLLGDSHD
eukprot:6492538-Amphidinium_carterae.2